MSGIQAPLLMRTSERVASCQRAVDLLSGQSSAAEVELRDLRARAESADVAVSACNDIEGARAAADRAAECRRDVQTAEALLRGLGSRLSAATDALRVAHLEHQNAQRQAQSLEAAIRYERAELQSGHRRLAEDRRRLAVTEEALRDHARRVEKFEARLREMVGEEIAA